jgi:hypothetical protein
MKIRDGQLTQIADFTSNLSLVFFATVITPIFADIQEMNLLITVEGLSLSLVSLFVSMILLRKI